MRNRPERDVSLGAAMAEETRRLKRTHRAVGGVARAWAATAPPGLAGRCEVVRLARGVLTLRVPDGSTRFAVDRWLRSGGQEALAADMSTTLSRVRLVL